MVSSNQFNKQSIILYISVVKSDKQERSRIVQYVQTVKGALQPLRGVKEGGLPNPAYHFSRQLFGIHILHTKKSTSQILHTPYHFQTFKSPIPKKSRTISCIPKKMKDKSCFRVFYLGPKMFGNLLSSIIYRLQRGQRDSSITLFEMLSG